MRPADRARGRRGALRPLPRADHLPDHRWPWARDLLRRPGAGPRRPREIPERTGDRALPQGRRALRHGGGAQAAARGRRRRAPGGGRGLYGRDRLPTCGRRRRGPAGHRPDRRPDGSALEAAPGADPVLRRRRRGPPGRQPGHRPGLAAAEARQVLPLRPDLGGQGRRRRPA